MFGIYNRYLGGKLKKMYLHNRTMLESHFLENYNINLGQILKKIKTLADIDKSIVAPHFGFTSCEEYHRISSCASNLYKIKTPTMFLMSLDDPIIGSEGIAYDECMANPNILLAITKKGGHLGFFESFITYN